MESENGTGGIHWILRQASCCMLRPNGPCRSHQLADDGSSKTAAKTRRNTRHQLTPLSKREPGVVAPSRELLFLGGTPSCSSAGGSQSDVGLLGQGKTKLTVALIAPSFSSTI